MNESRAKFEKWYSDYFKLPNTKVKRFVFLRNDVASDLYEHTHVQQKWATWQAARDALCKEQNVMRQVSGTLYPSVPRMNVACNIPSPNDPNPYERHRVTPGCEVCKSTGFVEVVSKTQFGVVSTHKCPRCNPDAPKK